jgi:serine phosphatase RsbU (regulator of sigma subunit)/pSer/pThr/pTyr-binding forkhead associated (FHA) protein
MTLRLRIVSADGRRFDHEVEGDSLVIGRSSRADLALADRAMSREHARIRKDDDGWSLEDLGSHNGTRLNEVPIEGSRRLRDADSISVGGSVLVVEIQGEEGSPSGDSVIYRSARELLQSASGSTDVSGIGAPGRKAADRLHMLNQVNQALASSISLEELLELILDRAFEHLKPQEAAIYLRDAVGNDVCAARRSIKGRESRPMHSKSLLHEVIDKGMVAHVVDSAMDERFAASKSLMMSGLRSFIAAPLLDAQGALGMIVVGAALGVRSFRDEDLELLVSLASVAALRIRNVRLVAEAMERQKLEQEVRLARQIQVALLPSSLPEVPGWELYGGNLPSRGVSGDFYKVLFRGDGTTCAILVADVSGKGVAASLLTASLEALSALPLEGNDPPDRICEQVGKLLHQRTPPEKYATAFLGILEPATGRMRWTNAGHNPALLLRAGGETEWLKSNGVPLGLLPGAKYKEGESTLQPGDAVLIYTDGITEALNPEDEEYGETGLQEAAGRHGHLSVREMAANLEKDLDAFARGVPFHDDRTLVIIRRSA